MGAVDLVIQIEAPASIASGIQRIGRAGHPSERSRGGSSSPSTAATCSRRRQPRERMREGKVEETAYPAQSARRARAADRGDRGNAARSASRSCGRSCAARRPSRSCRARRSRACSTCCRAGIPPTSSRSCARASRGTAWAAASVRARAPSASRSSTRGTIPDRGLYGVFLAGDGPRAEPARGRARRGDGLRVASRRRLRARRLVLADRGDHARPRDRLAGARASPERCRSGTATVRAGHPSSERRSESSPRRLSAEPPEAAARRLREDNGLDEKAATSLVAYLKEQKEATDVVPSDRTIVVERYRDEIGDWRVCILSPFGARVHAPWATAALARLKQGSGADVEAIWSDDGIVFRLPESDEPPERRF